MGLINNSTKDNTLESIKNDTILVCPRCYTIPSLLLEIKNGKVHIKFKCRNCVNKIMDFEDYVNKLEKQTLHFCTDQHFHQSVVADKYCIDCQNWVCQQCIINHQIYFIFDKHTFISHELSIETTCDIHFNSKLSMYCWACEESICPQCKLDYHDNHANQIKQGSTKGFDRFRPQFYFELLDTTFNEYKTKTSTLLSLLDETKLYSLKIKKDLMSSFANYEKNNKILKSFAMILRRNTQVLHKYFNFNLYQNIFINLQISICRPLLKYKNPEDNAKCLIEYFSTNGFYVNRNPIQKISIINANCQITKIIQTADSKLAMSLIDGTIQIWNIHKLYFEYSLDGHLGFVRGLIQLQDERIVSGSDDCTIIFWDLKQEIKNRQTIVAHQLKIFDLVQLRNDTLVSCSLDCTIKLWNVDTYNCLVVMSTQNHSALYLSVLEDGNYASAMADHSIIVWDGITQRQLNRLESHQNLITCLRTLKNNKLVSGSYDWYVIIWDTSTYTKINSINVGFPIDNLIDLNDCTLLLAFKNAFCKLNLLTMKIINKTKIQKDKLFKYMVKLEDGRVGIAFLNKLTIWTV